MLPELEAGVLDELDEGDEEAPRVRPVHDQPLQEHPSDLERRMNIEIQVNPSHVLGGVTGVKQHMIN